MSEGMPCRVCGARLARPAFDDPGPSLTSIRTVLAMPTRVFLCPDCGHAQSPDLPDIRAFYDTQYRISLDIDGHDQLYQNRAGQAVFRTVYQAEMVQALEIPEGARVLDFGAGKATTLERLIGMRPDLSPHVFDVSRDYVTHWDTWVPKPQQATYELPPAWSGRFDLVTAHFVLEHVPDPVTVLAGIRRCLAPGGRLFFTVPDAGGNTGDLLVVDHLNHFSLASLEHALHRAGLRALEIDPKAFAGAFAVVAEAGEGTEPEPGDNGAAQAALDFWRRTLDWLAATPLKQPLAIYGAGFYGSAFATRIRVQPACFLDRNTFLQGQSHLGAPVLAPADCPVDTATILVGLNPARAREIIEADSSWVPVGARLIYPAA